MASHHDKTGLSQFGHAQVEETPDGQVSREQYNLNHGREANAPTVGGSKRPVSKGNPLVKGK
jgi:hypothetical protein